MRQFPQSEKTVSSAPARPTDQSSPIDGYPLHLALQSVLTNLDTQLEAELERYRKALIQEGKAPGRRSSDHKLGLMALLTGNSRAQLASESIASPSPVASRQSKVPAAPPVPLNQISPVEVPEPPEPIPVMTPNQALPELKVSSLLTNSALTVTQPGSHQAELTSNAKTTSLASNASPELDGYLESSEELLRSLRQEETEIHSEQQFMKSLLTPLGIGSMALLLLSSAVFGYVLMNPSTLSQLLANRPVAPQASSPGQTGSSGVAPVPNLAAQEFKDLNLQNLGSLPGGPSGSSATLRSQSPKNPSTPIQRPIIASGVVGAAGIGTIASTNKATAAVTAPSPAASVATVSAPPRQASSPAIVEPAPTRRSTASAASQSSPQYAYNQPRRSTVAPAPARPRPVAPAPTAAARLPVRPVPVAPAPANPNSVAAKSPATAAEPLRYKVVTPFESDRALESARKVVPDAYVRNTADGAKVQLGAYPDARAAEAKVEELRQQGISAEVYNP